MRQRPRGMLGAAVASAGTKDVNILDFLPGLMREPSKSGQAVNYQTALQSMAWLACTQVLCNGVAQSPWTVQRARKGGVGSDPATDHPLYRLIHRRPNDYQTSFDFRRTLVLHLTLAGNAFVYVSRGAGRKILELIPIEPGQVTVTRRLDLSLVYTVNAADGTSQRTLSSEDMWHLRGLSWNGWMGMEALKLAREAVGLSLALEEAHSRLHANGVQPSGTYSVDGTLTEDQHTKLTAWIKRHASASAAGGPLILDKGAKWLAQQMTGVDAEHLATRQFQVLEVCRATNVQPIMVFAQDKPTYASAEQTFQAHVTHTINPVCENLKQSGDVFLLGVADDQDVFTHFDTDGLIPGSIKDRGDYLAKLTGAGGGRPILTQDEARAEVNYPPMGGEAGKLREPISAAKPDATKPAGDKPNPDDTEDLA